MRLLKDEMVSFLSGKDIAEMTERLAKEIQRDYEDKDVVFICPLKGSIHFLTDLVRRVDIPSQIDFVYYRPITKGGAIEILKDISVNIANKHVIVVEEIIDTGRTLNFLKERIQSSYPQSVRIVTLLDKPARRELQIRADYIGKTINDRYVVGYGMDSEELGRNYPDIYNLKN